MEEKKINISYIEYKPEDKLQDEDMELINKALEAAEQSYSPYSKFPVGCAIRTGSGKIFSASNQENVAFPAGTCAERSVLSYYHSNYPNDPVVKLLVLATKYKSDIPLTPCGLCRQSIAELEYHQKNKIEIILHQPEGLTWIFPSIQDLLPLGFESF